MEYCSFFRTAWTFRSESIVVLVYKYPIYVSLCCRKQNWLRIVKGAAAFLNMLKQQTWWILMKLHSIFCVWAVSAFLCLIRFIKIFMLSIWVTIDYCFRLQWSLCCWKKSWCLCFWLQFCQKRSWQYHGGDFLFFFFKNNYLKF